MPATGHQAVKRETVRQLADERSFRGNRESAIGNNPNSGASQTLVNSSTC
jgi:hypothetical protein